MQEVHSIPRNQARESRWHPHNWSARVVLGFTLFVCAIVLAIGLYAVAKLDPPKKEQSVTIAHP